MIDFNKIYQTLNLPKGDTEYSTSEPFCNSFIRIGKNIDDKPVILINPGEKVSLIDYRLKYINIEHNVLCNISENKNQLSLHLTIIELNIYSDTLSEYFLNVSEDIVSKLSKNPNIKDFESVFKDFIKIFEKLMAPPLKTIQGLWSELLFISITKNPDFYVECWHSNPKQIFDFIVANKALEIKSTNNESRIHSFSLSQLNPNEDLELYVVSLIVNQSVNYGKSICDLIKDLKKKLNEENYSKILDVVAHTLGENLAEGIKINFDYKPAIDSIKFYDYVNIPRIKTLDVPSEVSAVKFNSNLGELDSIDISKVVDNNSIFSNI
tara:strand:+ start:382 stop:1350 length:969 start_codon:yes stop_codon:yes gene_type:complete